MNPIFIARNANEYCQIEPSINSTRVKSSQKLTIQISFVFKKQEQMDILVVKKVASFFERRAQQLQIFRKKAIDGFDISLLVTNKHLEKFNKTLLIEWILEFVEKMDTDIKEIKLNLNTQTRLAATYLVDCFNGKNKMI